MESSIKYLSTEQTLLKLHKIVVLVGCTYDEETLTNETLFSNNSSYSYNKLRERGSKLYTVKL